MEDSTLPPLPEHGTYQRLVPRPVPQSAKRAADWLYWVAGASVANAVLASFGARFGLIISLESASVLGSLVHRQASLVSIVFALMTLGAVALIVVAGVRISKGSWGWTLAAAVPLCLDTLVMFVGMPETLLSLAFRAYVLYLLVTAFNANREWSKNPTMMPPLDSVPEVMQP